MTKRPGAAALAGGTLLALLCPGVAIAQDGGAYPREVSGGYASWTTAGGELADHGVTLDVTAPAVRGSADRAWFPATGGGADPGSGDAEVELGGSAQLTGVAQPLTLGALRLELDGGSGVLHARTAADGVVRELALADVESGAAPVVRTGGVTWTGLRASLTAEGAELLSAWSGREFTRGDDLGLLDVTVGTGSGTGDDTPGTAPEEASEEPAPGTAAPEQPAGDAKQQSAPSATVALAALAAGGEQQVTGAGFEPGEVVLVAIDDDTRYQATADEEGRVSRAFPVYTTAAEGAHTVELYTVTGKRGAAADFEVRPTAG
ncbi:HtaA domain-containing protein [Streptomyces sp. SID13726]|uniref:HtaA domain-containing protein n=1 Tax=Streptomyces sp. SID13726 TaxID=2706058 RepID=UPI0013B93FF5|nr:HtaA domain-containing protein [Streptomyces sp. SID13726]NEA98233.1 hypothetical protein [Streptomyces sp. SID13726]